MMDEHEPAVDRPSGGGSTEGPAAAGDPRRESAMDALRNVYDPELGVNIVDLGLVYDVEIRDGDVDVTYTLTTMGCPIGPLIEAQIQQHLLQLPGIERVNVEMVLRPPWSPEMMSDEAKAALGFF